MKNGHKKVGIEKEERKQGCKNGQHILRLQDGELKGMVRTGRENKDQKLYYRIIDSQSNTLCLQIKQMLIFSILFDLSDRPTILSSIFFSPLLGSLSRIPSCDLFIPRFRPLPWFPCANQSYSQRSAFKFGFHSFLRFIF